LTQQNNKLLDSTNSKHGIVLKKEIARKLPTIGILVFQGIIINEVVAPLDVFSDTSLDNKMLFNVVTIAKEDKTYSSDHGLK